MGSIKDLLIRLRFDNSKFEDISGNTIWNYSGSQIAYSNDTPFGAKYKRCYTTGATEVDLQSITTENNSLTLSNKTGVTVSFWVYRLSGYTYGSKGYIFSLRNDLSGAINGNMLAAFDINNDLVFMGRWNRIYLSDAVWHHVVISSNIDVMKVFVDGELISSNDSAIDASAEYTMNLSNSNSSFFFIKNNTDVHNFFNGSIFDFNLINAPIKHLKIAKKLLVPTDYIDENYVDNAALLPNISKYLKQY